MDSLINILKESLVEHQPCSGQFFHIRCSAHILNLIVQAGMARIEECVAKLRENVNYIDINEARLNRFYACALAPSLPTNSKLWLDVSTRWNSTYLMLKRTLFFRKALDQFGENEPNYIHCISHAQWTKAEKVCELLAPFNDITNLFSGSNYPTANVYFCNVWRIEKLLRSSQMCLDPEISNMANKMYKKFEKYWGHYSMILSFALILDPRFKLDFVLYHLKKLHGFEDGSRMGNEVHVKFVELFNYYEKNNGGPSTKSVETQGTPSTSNDEFSDYFECEVGGRPDGARAGVTEYDAYFTAALHDRSTVDFDILSYWGKMTGVYSTLSSMARDILAIPITTVASESSFSMGGRICNSWRSSLLSTKEKLW